MTRNMAYGVGAELGNRRVLVAVHTSGAPSESEWSSWVSFLEKLGAEVDQDLTRLPNLVITDGGAPTTQQRTAVNVLVAQGKTMPPVAVVTDSAMVRTMLRAFSLFNPRIRAFAPSEFGLAITHLGVPATEQKALAQTCRRLEMELGSGTVRTVDALFKS